MGMECLWRKKDSSECEKRRLLQLNCRIQGEEGGGAGKGVGGGGGGRSRRGSAGRGGGTGGIRSGGE